MEVDASMPYYPLGSRERHQLDEQLRLTRERELALERMRQLRQACTFQPEIELTTTDGLAWNNNNNNSNNNTSSPSTSVFDRLQKQGEDVVRRRQERIAEKEMEDAERLAESFQPAINHRYAHNHQRVRALSEVPVEERLLHYGKCVAMTVERKREQQHREMEERSEHHQQHTSGDTTINKDRLHEFEARNAAFVQQREEKREAARRVAEEAISFQPTISPTSCALDQHRLERHDSAATRLGGTHPHASSISRGAMLYEQAMRSKHSRTTLADDNGDGDDDVGAPRINPLSQQWIDHGPHQHLFQHNFVARQALYQQVSKEHRHMLREQQQSMEKMPTKRQTYSDGGANTVEASIQRLYYEAKQKRQDQQQQQQHARASSSSTATFTPSLSPGTEQVLRHMRGRERDVVRRLTTPRGGAEVAEEEPNKRERENLYARPSRPSRTSSTATTRAACAQQSCGGEGGSSPRHRASSVEMSAFLQRQADALHQRQQHVREAQQQQAVQDVAQCTFTPRTNSTIHRPSTTNTTRDDDATGVARFVARQRAAQRLRAEQQERMEQLGRGKPINGPNYTIFTPFRFQDERTRGASLAEEHQAATMPTTTSEVVKENLPCGSVATPSRHVDVHVAADDVGARRTSSKKRSVSFAPTSYRSDRLMQQLRPTST